MRKAGRGTGSSPEESAKWSENIHTSNIKMVEQIISRVIHVCIV